MNNVRDQTYEIIEKIKEYLTNSNNSVELIVSVSLSVALYGTQDGTPGK